MHIDLNEYSLKELKELHQQILRAISTFEDRRKREAIAALEEKAREMGFTFAELSGVAPMRKRAPATAKYANPANRAETWSGRGRKPRWFDAALKAGKQPEDMAI